jgi:hypothetical protein
MLFAKKSWPAYIMLTLFPVSLLIRGITRQVAFALFGVLCVTVHSYWASLLWQFTATDLHAGLVGGNLSCLLFFLMELLLMAGYTWLFVESIRELRHSHLASAGLASPTGATNSPQIPA